MDILKILNENADTLLLPDLDYYERKLAVSGYEPAERIRCQERINDLRAKLQNAAAASHVRDHRSSAPKQTVPSGVKREDRSLQFTDPEKIRQKVYTDLCLMRTLENYKSGFKSYIAEMDLINETFLAQNLSLFQPWEISAILSVMPLSEEFLDKFFDSLDAEKIARCQLFSEGFFMKHYAKLDPQIVLEKGVNPWRKKENRSRQLDIFLRLKGIRY